VNGRIEEVKLLREGKELKNYIKSEAGQRMFTMGKERIPWKIERVRSEAGFRHNLIGAFWSLAGVM